MATNAIMKASQHFGKLAFANKTKDYPSTSILFPWSMKMDQKARDQYLKDLTKNMKADCPSGGYAIQRSMVGVVVEFHHDADALAVYLSISNE